MPLYLWDDEPWIFYAELWQKELIGFSYRFPQLEEVRFWDLLGWVASVVHWTWLILFGEWKGSLVICIYIYIIYIYIYT